MTQFTPQQREQLDAMARKLRERRAQATGKSKPLPEEFRMENLRKSVEFTTEDILDTMERLGCKVER